MISRTLYTILFALLLPLVLLRLLWRSRAHAGYRQRMAERFGFVSPAVPGGIWVHAVSVGETIAAIPLVERLLQQYPQLCITLTTTTPTGSDRVRAAFGDRVHHVYAPYDLPFCVSHFLRRVQPRLCLIMETELWPNLIHACAARGVRTMLINARLSKRSARGYRKVAWLTRPMLQQLTMVAAQQAADARRLIRVGLRASHCQITGSVKSDVQLSCVQLQAGTALRAQLGTERYVLIAASTHAGEDELILQAWKKVRAHIDDVVLILVPRHPERFDAVFALAQSCGVEVARRSLGNASMQTGILIGDTMGELMAMYAAADVAFVGGSLVPRGGHNLLEPVACGVPVVQGLHTFNFAVLSKQFRRARAMIEVRQADELAQAWIRLKDPAMRRDLSERASQQLRDLRGALARVEALISAQLLD